MLFAAAGFGYGVRALTSGGDQDALRAQQRAASRKFDRLLNNVAATQGVKPDTLLGKGLKSPASLPGHDDHVTDGKRSKLAASTVAIVSRSRFYPSYSWQATCSGNKISIGGNPYILTARHCLEASYGSSRVKPGTYAADVLSADDRSYAITQAPTNSIKDDRTPIAKVTAASVTVSGEYQPDMALLEVSPITEGDGVGIYDRIPAIPLKNYAIRPPQPGSEAAFYGVPTSVSNIAVGGIGTYLGRMGPHDGTPYQTDVFGFDVSDARKDPVEFGSSGSGAIGVNGHMFGPLTRRSSLSAVKHTPATILPSPQERIAGLRTSDALGIDTSPYTVIASTTVPPMYVFRDLVSGLDSPLAGAR